jgi:hypothetical protein
MADRVSQDPIGRERRGPFLLFDGAIRGLRRVFPGWSLRVIGPSLALPRCEALVFLSRSGGPFGPAQEKRQRGCDSTWGEGLTM